jgi:acetoin utilization deacetylase AcuC-like enzyme
LSEALQRIFLHQPDIVFYLGGADPFEKDKLGRLSLTKEGLMKRDEMVLEYSKNQDVPIVTTMSGGYAENIEDTVDIHANTIRAVKKVFFAKVKTV